MTFTKISLSVALSVALLSACRGKEPTSPNATPTSSGDAGTTSTTSGPSYEPNSPDMTKSGSPTSPARGDPPQILPPEISPK